MLQMIDAMLAQATTNNAFNVQIPLLDISIKKIIGVASVFTSALFEFFVMVPPINERKKKSLVVKG